VNGCEFMDGGKRAIKLDSGVKAASIFGCAFRNAQAVENNSKGDVQMGMNTGV